MDKIKTIAHLADIHIRKLHRFVEYRDVFNRLYKKNGAKCPKFLNTTKIYIIPPIPPIPPISGIGGIGVSSLGTSVTIASVVIIIPATEPAA